MKKQNIENKKDGSEQAENMHYSEFENRSHSPIIIRKCTNKRRSKRPVVLSKPNSHLGIKHFFKITKTLCDNNNTPKTKKRNWDVSSDEDSCIIENNMKKLKTPYIKSNNPKTGEHLKNVDSSGYINNSPLKNTVHEAREITNNELELSKEHNNIPDQEKERENKLNDFIKRISQKFNKSCEESLIKNSGKLGDTNGDRHFEKCKNNIKNKKEMILNEEYTVQSVENEINSVDTSGKYIIETVSRDESKLLSEEENIKESNGTDKEHLSSISSQLEINVADDNMVNKKIYTLTTNPSDTILALKTQDSNKINYTQIPTKKNLNLMFNVKENVEPEFREVNTYNLKNLILKTKLCNNDCTVLKLRTVTDNKNGQKNIHNDSMKKCSSTRFFQSNHSDDAKSEKLLNFIANLKTNKADHLDSIKTPLEKLQSTSQVVNVLECANKSNLTDCGNDLETVIDNSTDRQYNLNNTIRDNPSNTKPKYFKSKSSQHTNSERNLNLIVKFNEVINTDNFVDNKKPLEKFKGKPQMCIVLENSDSKISQKNDLYNMPDVEWNLGVHSFENHTNTIQDTGSGTENYKYDKKLSEKLKKRSVKEELHLGTIIENKNISKKKFHTNTMKKCSNTQFFQSKNLENAKSKSNSFEPFLENEDTQCSESEMFSNFVDSLKKRTGNYKETEGYKKTQEVLAELNKSVQKSGKDVSEVFGVHSSKEYSFKSHSGTIGDTESDRTNYRFANKLEKLKKKYHKSGKEENRVESHIDRTGENDSDTEDNKSTTNLSEELKRQSQVSVYRNDVFDFCNTQISEDFESDAKVSEKVFSTHSSIERSFESHIHVNDTEKYKSTNRKLKKLKKQSLVSNESISKTVVVPFSREDLLECFTDRVESNLQVVGDIKSYSNGNLFEINTEAASADTENVSFVSSMLGLEKSLKSQDASDIEIQTEEKFGFFSLNVPTGANRLKMTSKTTEFREPVFLTMPTVSNENSLKNKGSEELPRDDIQKECEIRNSKEIMEPIILNIRDHSNKTNLNKKCPEKLNVKENSKNNCIENLLNDEEVYSILSREYKKYKKRIDVIEAETCAENACRIDKLTQMHVSRMGRNVGKEKCYLKKYRKGKLKIYRLKKLKKLKNTEVHDDTAGDLNFGDVLKQITQTFIEPESQLTRSTSDCSISTHSSYVTDDSKSETFSTDSEELNTPQQRLRVELDKVLRDKTLLCEEEKRIISECDKSEIKMKIQNIFLRIYDDLTNGYSSSLKFRRQTFENCNFRDRRLQFKPVDETATTRISCTSKKSQARFKLILYVMNKVQALLETNTKLTKRELYYQLKDMIRNQEVVNRAINTVSCILDVGMWELNILAQKGLVFGDLKILMSNGETLNCSIPGTLIPQEIGEIVELQSRAYFILVVEKESIFQKLIEEDLPKKLTRPFIMITGKGFPDLNTQLFLRKLWIIMNLPVFILVDADPHGVQIMLNYRFGSVHNAHVSHHLAVPNAKWLGVYPSEIKDYDITTQPLTARELKLVEQLLKTPYMDGNPGIVAELRVLQEKKYKAGIEGLLKLSQIFLGEVYLPTKFFIHKFV